ncbi:hypothetical protein CANARDRAFT_28088 [[Candida] arabinofermentans NRRL YB-2248]|uniref:protein-serine/threonine phosphatase n=1 Tax=[Candida] arabinofermentans NRRL YB-2248 TaxID=983967 RepID=A0A1E4T2X7_9ASCO|nr:hypothetical protein CANARDRAFT_28088 [[Candida] arabinofermentans NRRL YB-2248]
MGQILSQPVTEKSSEEGGDEFLAYGLSCMQGWRISMEDSHSTILDLNKLENKDSDLPQTAFFGVYDGHGGEKVALFTGDHLPTIITNTDAYKVKNYQQALKDGFLAADVAILKDDSLAKDPSGCAATSAIITKEKIICGNAGDSRTIMSVNGDVKPLSFDHKPTNEGEKARIVAAGGFVDLGRVNGNLALSRGIGDFEFKSSHNLPAEEQAVTAYPDVIEHDVSSDDEFVVLACDGIWDCLSSQQVIDFVRRGIKSKQSLTEICESMMDTCLAPTSGGSGIGCDNMSVCIVALLHGQTLEEWYEKIAAKITDVSQYPSPDELSMNLYKVTIESKFSNSRDDEQQTGRRGGLGSARSHALRTGAAVVRSANDEDDDDDDSIGSLSGATLSMQQLLAASNVSTGNNIVYLDSRSILDSLGVMRDVVQGKSDDDDDDDDDDEDRMEEIQQEEEEEEEEESPSKE